MPRVEGENVPQRSWLTELRQAHAAAIPGDHGAKASSVATLQQLTVDQRHFVLEFGHALHVRQRARDDRDSDLHVVGLVNEAIHRNAELTDELPVEAPPHGDVKVHLIETE